MVSWTCWISASTLGVMRSSIGFGYTPTNTIAAMNGSSSAPSFQRSSAIDLFSSSGSPWKTRWYAHRR